MLGSHWSPCDTRRTGIDSSACILEERDGSIRKIEVTLSTSASLVQGLSSEQKATNLGRMVAARLIEEGALEMLASMRAAEGKQALSG